MRACWALVFALWANGLFAAVNPNVVVDHRPAEIAQRTFDPARPPPHLIRSPGIEAAYCETEFFCGVDADTERPRVALKTVTVTIKKVTVKVRLKITLWLPDNYTPEILAHEETHRAIAEHYYADAAAIARRQAEKLVGQKVTVPRKTAEASAQEAFQVHQTVVSEGFLDATARRSTVAQARFDEITDHGRDPIANAEAKARALAAEEADWAAKQRGEGGDLK